MFTNFLFIIGTIFFVQYNELYTLLATSCYLSTDCYRHIVSAFLIGLGSSDFHSLISRWSFVAPLWQQNTYSQHEIDTTRPHHRRHPPPPDHLRTRPIRRTIHQNHERIRPPRRHPLDTPTNRRDGTPKQAGYSQRRQFGLELVLHAHVSGQGVAGQEDGGVCGGGERL